MKKVLFLGGSKQQIPAIEYGKEQGYYTVLCDYLNDNPGQYVADKFYCVSTTDFEAILDVAIKEKVDGIVAYASDPAALTAAYVGNKLGLISNPYDSVEILSKKNLFRAFLKENNFNCPNVISLDSKDDLKFKIKNLTFPLMVKPIDSSGSKGISKVLDLRELEEKFEIAMNMSRDKIVVIEEFIQRDHDYMIGGDAFVVNGKVVFYGLLNSHRDYEINELVPVGTSYPTFLNEDRIQKVKNEVQRVVDILGMKEGALNLELMFGENDKLYIIEIGPRNGGNMIPDIIRDATGVDMIKATVDSAIGKKVELESNNIKTNFSTYVMHSGEAGILESISLSKELEDKITKRVDYKKTGDNIEFFDGANKALGILFLKFNDLDEEKYILENVNNMIEVKVIK